MTSVQADNELIRDITARLDLREPNAEALESIALALSQHYDVDGRDRPWEAVVDVATGVGKTYVMASAIEYLAQARGIRNVAVITPGRTILRKTEANFTPGHTKSLLGPMSVRPVVVTADNFASAHMRAAMDDPQHVKLFIFTVQALLKPQTSEAGRRTHKFQEGLGKAFYDHLRSLADLVVFADEHHTYYGDAFSAAIRDLHPLALIGLTATPHKKTPEEQIIYRYPLAAAIASHLVKTPVIVGRQDDRTDIETKLHDGVRLLAAKRAAIERYRAETGAPPVNPVMLVIAKDIQAAKECEVILNDPSFDGGAYQGHILEVTSASPDEALEKLDRVEDPESPVHIIVSVGMLKEGWDVKNVYVITSLRSSISEMLTEQTLGRGLRLPFGDYTGRELLDTVEVLAHERYEDLLRRANVLNETFIDYRTRPVIRMNAAGEQVTTRETTRVGANIDLGPTDEPALEAYEPAIRGAEQRIAQAENDLRLSVQLAPRDDLEPLRIPRLVMRNVQATFSLDDITDLDPFRRLGQRLASSPAEQLRRTAVGARIITGPNGMRQTELVTSSAVDVITSQATLIPLDKAIDELRALILNAPFVPGRKGERVAAQRLVDAVLQGLGERAGDVLSVYMDRVAAELLRLTDTEYRRYLSQPTFEHVVEVETFAPTRTGRTTASSDRYGSFNKATGYEGWRRSMYSQVWFDSSTERSVANVLDDADQVRYWVRLLIGDLPILWSGAGSWYHPDFVAVETDGTHWIIEVKADNDLASSDVQDKKQAAKRWSNYVSSDPNVGAQWRYLLVSETQIESVKGSWPALKALG